MYFWYIKLSINVKRQILNTSYLFLYWISVTACNKKIIELEGQRGVLQILLTLQRNGEILYGKLYNNKPLVEISNNLTAKRALNLLAHLYRCLENIPYLERKYRVYQQYLISIKAAYPSGLRGRSAKPLFIGSNPIAASS